MRARFGLIFAASGAAALIYEVTWTRLLTLQVGHGVAAASTVLAAFMGGLAIGSAWGGRAATRISPRRALKLYASLELGIAALALILPLELRALDPLLAIGLRRWRRRHDVRAPAGQREPRRCSPCPRPRWARPSRWRRDGSSTVPAVRRRTLARCTR